MYKRVKIPCVFGIKVLQKSKKYATCKRLGVKMNPHTATFLGNFKIENLNWEGHIPLLEAKQIMVLINNMQGALYILR